MSATFDCIARKLGLDQAHAGAPAKPAAPRQPAKLANVTAALNAASAKLPPPAPAPMPAPARQPPRLTSVAIQRNADGRIAAVSVAGSNGSRHHLAARRDQLGRMNAVVVDDRSVWRLQRGGYGEITGLVPVADAPMEYDK